MQAQLLPIFLLTMPLALCFICIWGCDAKERALAPVRSLAPRLRPPPRDH
jgi:hypothetical protein